MSTISSTLNGLQMFSIFSCYRHRNAKHQNRVPIDDTAAMHFQVPVVEVPWSLTRNTVTRKLDFFTILGSAM